MAAEIKLCKHGLIEDKCGQCDEVRLVGQIAQLRALPVRPPEVPAFTADEARLLGVSTPQILKILRLREKNLLDRIYGEVKQGNLNQAAALAEFGCLRDIQNDIENTLKRHAAQEEKAYDTGNDPDTAAPSSR